MKVGLISFNTSVFRSCFFAFSFFLSSLSAVGQAHSPDSIDQFDANGRKHGIWTEYLTADLVRTRKEKAVFYRYTFYDHGRNVDKISYVVRGKSLKTDGNEAGEKGRPVLLHGNYLWYYKSGQIQMNLTFENGRRKGKAFYYYRTGYYSEVIDFDNKFEDQEFSYYLEAYENNGKKYAEGYYRHGERGWTGYLEYQ